jgi:hypothetical protein
MAFVNTNNSKPNDSVTQTYNSDVTLQKFKKIMKLKLFILTLLLLLFLSHKVKVLFLGNNW